jgi:PadR family transcriptional regulator, regulatory protein PadR
MDEIRMTGPVLKVLRELISSNQEGISGADIGRATRLASGTLYPILFRLEKSGWVQSKWERVEPSLVKRPRRRLYRLTRTGEVAAQSSFRELLPLPEKWALRA